MYLVNGQLTDTAPAHVNEAEARKGTIAYGILKAHNTAPDMKDPVSYTHLAAESRSNVVILGMFFAGMIWYNRIIKAILRACPKHGCGNVRT